MKEKMSTIKNLPYWTILIVLVGLACGIAQPTPQPSVEVQQLVFEIQTATPTIPAVLSLIGASTATPISNAPDAFVPPLSQTVTATTLITSTLQPEIAVLSTPLITTTAEPTPEPFITETVVAVIPTAIPESTPTIPPAEPLRGGEWDFEIDFVPWVNPHGDACSGSGLANGWSSFTTRDEYGSSCLNQTTWRDNVYTGQNAQEITFAYVGNQAGIFKTAPTVLGHQYIVEAHMRRESSPAKVEVVLGIDLNGGVNWQAETVQWFPWQEDFENQWSRTAETVTATGESMTVFIKGSHPYPEPGGTLRINNISVVDLGPG